MVLAAALISLAVLVPPAEPQAAAPPPLPPQSTAPGDTSKPYTVEGVRRASGAKIQPPIDTGAVERDPRGYRMAIATTSSPCGFVSNYCGSPFAAPAYPTWHDQFVVMAGPQNYMVPYTGMSNGERVQAVASSIGITLALQAVVSLIHDQVVKSSHNRKLKKVEKIRGEIRGELEELERLNAAPRK
jgi:hypothetical protein